MAGKYGLRRRSITAFGARPLAVLMVATPPLHLAPHPEGSPYVESPQQLVVGAQTQTPEHSPSRAVCVMT